MVAILTGVRWNLSVVLISISFIRVLFGHLDFSFEKDLFSSVTHFFNGSLIFEEFSFLSSLYILYISPLSDV
jgi:hypothetical protein